jgi:hypothetical protein
LPTSIGGLVAGSVNAAESSKVQFDASTGKLTWNVGGLAAHAGKFAPARKLEFKISVNPSQSQVGRSLTLVKDIKLSAKDLFTAEAVEAVSDEISSDDLAGEHFGNGQVVN